MEEVLRSLCEEHMDELERSKARHEQARIYTTAGVAMKACPFQLCGTRLR